MTIPVSPTGESVKDGAFSDFFNCQSIPDNGKVRMRLLAGPFTRRIVWYPTIGKNRETGKFEFTGQTITSNHADPYKHFFTSIAKAEKAMQAEDGIKSPSPKLKLGTTFFYVGILRGKEKPTLEIIELKWRLQEQLEEKEKEESERKPGTFKYGPSFLYDITIEKTVEQGKPKKFGTRYTLSISDPELLMEQGLMNQISTNVARPEVPSKFEELVDKSFGAGDKAFFATPDGASTVVQEKCKEIEALRKADSNEAILKQLEEFPLNLFAFSDNSYEFHNPVKLFQIIQEKSDIKLLEQADVKKLQEEVAARETAVGTTQAEPTSYTEEKKETGSAEIPKEEVNPDSYNL